MRMKLGIALGLITGTLALGQTVVENPKKPLNPEDGRIVKLKEVLRIRDDGEKIVFKYPQEIQIGDDGSIYFYNPPAHFKYDAEGRFVFQVVRNGQGPGEAQYRTRSFLTPGALLVQGWSPPKIMRFGLDGAYLGEKRTDHTDLFEFITLVDGKLFVFREDSPEFEKVVNPGYYDVSYSLLETDPDLKTPRVLHSFPYQWYLRRGSGWQWAPFDFAYLDPDNLFVLHTQEYQISLYSLRKNMVTKIIKRKYDRVKRPPEKREERPGVIYPPPREFYSDVYVLLMFGGRLWAITSTQNDRQSRLVDVFDIDGRYLDCFYLEFPEGYTRNMNDRGSLSVKGGFLYSADQDAEGFFSIAKYKILDPGKREEHE